MGTLLASRCSVWWCFTFLQSSGHSFSYFFELFAELRSSQPGAGVGGRGRGLESDQLNFWPNQLWSTGHIVYRTATFALRLKCFYKRALWAYSAEGTFFLNILTCFPWSTFESSKISVFPEKPLLLTWVSKKIIKLSWIISFFLSQT